MRTMSNVVEEQSIYVYTKQDKVRVIGGSDDGKVFGQVKVKYQHFLSLTLVDSKLVITFI